MDRQLNSKTFVGILYEFLENYVDLSKEGYEKELINDLTEKAPGWFSFFYLTQTPMIAEDYLKPPPYYYPFLVRTSPINKRILLLSITDILINEFLSSAKLLKRVRAGQIKIPDLVHKLVEKPDVYCLSVIYAKVDGYGRSLRALSLYGADLGEAQLFRDILPKLVPFRVQLRDVRTGEDILQVGTKGEIGFSYRDIRTLNKVDKALTFLKDNGFLLWD